MRKIVKEMAGKSASFGGERASLAESVQVPLGRASFVGSVQVSSERASFMERVQVSLECAGLAKSVQVPPERAGFVESVQFSIICAASTLPNLNNSDSRPGGLLSKAAVER